MAGLYEGQEDFPIWLRSKLDSYKIGPEYDDFLQEILNDDGQPQSQMEKEVEEYLFDLICDREIAQKVCREISDRWTVEKERLGGDPKKKGEDKDGNKKKKPKEQEKRENEENNGNSKELFERKQAQQKTITQVEDDSISRMVEKKEVQQEKPKDDVVIDETVKKIEEKKRLESEDKESQILTESLRKFRMARARNLPRTRRDENPEFNETIQVSQKVNDDEAAIPGTKSDEGLPLSDPIPHHCNSNKDQKNCPAMTSTNPINSSGDSGSYFCTNQQLLTSNEKQELRLTNLERWERRLQLVSRLDREKCRDDRCEDGRSENEKQKRWEEMKQDIVLEKKQEGEQQPIKNKKNREEEYKSMQKKMREVKQLVQKKKQEDAEKEDKQEDK